MDTSVLGLVCVFLVGLLIDLFDISLPRGDSVGVGGALFAASIVVLGPFRALLMAFVSAVVAHLARRGADLPRRLVAVLAARGVAFAATIGAMLSFSVRTPELLVFAVLPAVYLVTELLVAQASLAIATSRPFMRLVRGNLVAQAPVIAAQWSAAVLLLLTYRGMRPYGLIPVAALLLLIRQSYSLFLDIREAYRTTVEVLVEAAESQDERREGHADRTAALARAIAMRIGLGAAFVERISYAALLHDLGEFADEHGVARDHERSIGSAMVVQGVEFFDQVVPILRICDGEPEGTEENEDDLLAAAIVALSSDIDAAQHPAVQSAHHRGALEIVAPRVPQTLKARVVGAAIELGYRIPAVD
jgi:hypothetical protein